MQFLFSLLLFTVQVNYNSLEQLKGDCMRDFLPSPVRPAGFSLPHGLKKNIKKIIKK